MHYDFVSSHVAAQILNLSVSRIHQLTKLGRLPCQFMASRLGEGEQAAKVVRIFEYSKVVEYKIDREKRKAKIK